MSRKQRHSGHLVSCQLGLQQCATFSYIYCFKCNRTLVYSYSVQVYESTLVQKLASDSQFLIRNIRISYRIKVHNSHAELTMYCPADSAPTLPNANTPIAVQTIGDSTFFTCNSGYVSSGLPIQPFYTCNGYIFTNGIYSSVNYSCQCIYEVYTVYSNCTILLVLELCHSNRKSELVIWLSL